MRRSSRSSRSAPRSRRLLRFAAASLLGAFVLGLLPAFSLHMSMNAMAEAQVTTPQITMNPHAPTKVNAGADLEQVLRGIMCRCGCNLTVFDCESTMTCEVSGKMRADAERFLASGMTPAQALDAFAADYGEQVLAAPTKKGFNLAAWILPFVALGIGGLVVVWALRSWRPRLEGPSDEEPAPQADPRYLAQVERELEEEE